MALTDIKKLKARWSTQERCLGESAITGEVKSPYDVTDDGLKDVRGLVVTAILRDAKICSVDLSGAKFEGFAQFSNCDTENTRFRSAEIGTNLGKSFHSCDFSSAKLTGAVLRGEFVSCDFTSANLAGAKGSQVRFSRCLFVNTNFQRALLLHSTFEDCLFRDCKYQNGSFWFSKFIRTPIDHENLRNTIMDKIVIT